MDVVVIGAGAMGCLFGALLAPHAKITLCCRHEQLAHTLSTRGIFLHGLEGGLQRVPVHAISTDKVLEGENFDYAIICTKAHAGSAAAAIAQALLRPDGLALTLQNGLGNRERLAEHLGLERSLVGITSQAATLLEPGQVRHAGAGDTVLAPDGGQQWRQALPLVALFNSAGISTTVTDDSQGLIWSKLLVNVGINALAALLRVPNGVLANEPVCRTIMAQAVEEAVQVAQASGVELPYEKPFEHVLELCVQTAANRASTLQDILRQAPTEVEVINGAVAALGVQYTIPTPVNSTLTQLIKALEATASERVA
ncbi:MAG: 2-dehydropantoate 2-reductase [Desulfobulbaceae bacterium]|nr:2-dehydropantoate 2-reductase [Desulfobulbaceae bacterium]